MNIEKIQFAKGKGIVANWRLPRLLKSAQPPSNKKVLAVWRLFFKSFRWLDEACRNGNPPILVGSALNDILQGGAAPRRKAHLALICQGVPNPSLFKECLQPHAMHSHGGVLQYDYAFESHNITLNAGCAFTGSIANAIHTRWPERLSVVSGQKRQSAYLVWERMTIEPTQAVSGLGRNLESDNSVSRICRINLQGYKDDIGVIFCKDASFLFQYDWDRSCYNDSDQYEAHYRKYITTINNRNGKTIEECRACNMKRIETPEML
jgi:hypothetical protein